VEGGKAALGGKEGPFGARGQIVVENGIGLGRVASACTIPPCNEVSDDLGRGVQSYLSDAVSLEMGLRGNGDHESSHSTAAGLNAGRPQ